MNAAKFKLAMVAALLLGRASAFAQAPEVKADTETANDRGTANVETAPVNRWLLICCGLPGDAEHRERLTEACRKIIAAADPVLGVEPEHLRILVGDETMKGPLGLGEGAGICTRETLSLAIEELAGKVRPDDACWIVLLGHAHLYDARSCFNIAGPDVDQDEFARWMEPLACREEVFWLTMPLSGFWIKPLGGENRVVLSATEADLEFTGTEMPYALADVLAGDARHQQLEDVDGDGAATLLDLYLATCRETHGRFVAMDRLQTEHAQLEDNGDGRGSEVQQPYLPVAKVEGESEAAPQPPKIPATQSLDGYQSRHILLRVPQ